MKNLERSADSRSHFGEVFGASLGSKIDQKSIPISSLNLIRLPNQPNLDFCRMSQAKCSFLKLKGEPKRGSQGTILERKIDLKNHQKSLSNSIGIGRGLATLGQQDSGGSGAAQEYLKILQNRRYEITIEDRSPGGSDTPWANGPAKFYQADLCLS